MLVYHHCRGGSWILFLISKSEIPCLFRCLFEEQYRPILVSCFRLGHGIQSAVPITTKLCVGGLQGFQRRIYRCETTNLLRRWIVLLQREGDFLSLLQKPAVSFLERRTSLDLRNSRSLRMFSLEFLSFRYRFRLL